MKNLTQCLLIAVAIVISSNALATRTYTSHDEYAIMMNSALQQLQENITVANNRLKELAEYNIILSKHNTDGRFIIVNRREQYIRVYDDHRLIIHEKVIVGKPSRPTKLFVETITAIVMAPKWSLPKSIAEEYFPKIKKSGGWEGYTIYVGGVATPIFDVNPNKSYRIVQAPGPTNALGSYKFNTKHGKHSIFIHDTPNKALFAKENRIFSSGCIRMQNPVKLASFLLNKTQPQVKTMLQRSNHSYYKSTKPIQLYVVDWHQWIDNTGKLIEK